MGNGVLVKNFMQSVLSMVVSNLHAYCLSIHKIWHPASVSHYVGIILTLHLLLLLPCFSQQQDTAWLPWEDAGLTASIQYLERPSVSIGVGQLRMPLTTHNLLSYTAEVEGVFDGGFLLAPKVGAHLNLIWLYAGASTAFYTNFHDSFCWTLNPELGMGFYYGYLVFGSRLRLTGYAEDFHLLTASIKALIPIGE